MTAAMIGTKQFVSSGVSTRFAGSGALPESKHDEHREGVAAPEGRGVAAPEGRGRPGRASGRHVGRDVSWMTRGACRRADPSLFFGEPYEDEQKRLTREARAKLVCAVCPVSESCRSYAIDAREAFGVWGGLGEDERPTRRKPRLTLRAVNALPDGK